VLAHAYLRYDSVLDKDLPLEIPMPPIAEIQVALHEAVRPSPAMRAKTSSAACAPARW
jgi:nucleoside phosphorylase